jgi:hypothetical protein
MAAALPFAATARGAFAAEPVNRAEINRILDAAMNRGEVMEIAQHLTDRIGSRMTNSPGMREAERWTQAKFREWGLRNVRAEPFDFGRGWSIESSSVRMTAPRPLTLRAIPVAWTPGTNGPVSAPVVVALISKDDDFAKHRGKLRGRIVLVSQPGTGSEPTEPAFQRRTSEELSKLDVYDPAETNLVQRANALKRRGFAGRLDAFLKGEGAVAWARISRRDGGMLHGEGSGFRVGQTPQLPGIELAAEDYRRIARLAKTGPVTLEIDSRVRWHDEDRNAYNIIAELPGTDPSAGYVMAGAHMDSWAASDGAVDNAAGVAVVMEAARILSTLGIRPKRSVRFALWSGEEQGILGSLAYVDRHLATRPPDTDARRNREDPWATWRNRYPITPKPGYRELAAYFNLDNGSGKIRGIYTEGNVAAVPIFREWLAPFASLGASTVANRPTGGTDHVYLQSVGLPGYQFIQDPLDYGSRLHHTSNDSFDHIKGEDLRQAAVIMATFLLNAANRPEALPRMPLPTQPRPTDPFEYPKED